MARYSKREISRAGSRLANSEDPAAELDSREIVNYWRSVHRLPLQCLLDDAGGSVFGCARALIAGRIKKLDTIVDKLRRSGTPSDLRTMYDIAGCRVIVEDMRDLEAACSRMLALSACNRDKSSAHDYIASPRRSGYRGRHFVFNYPSPDFESGLWAELQVRTELQHAWATSVETYDLAAEKSRLKFNEIDNGPGEFFRIVSRLIEVEEGGPGLAPVQRGELVSRLAAIEKSHGVLGVLGEARGASSILYADRIGFDGGYCLIDLNVEEQCLSVEGLPAEAAVDAYFDREGEEGHNLVLVRGDSLEQIKRAYPNYFGDISRFIKFVEGILG